MLKYRVFIELVVQNRHLFPLYYGNEVRADLIGLDFYSQSFLLKLFFPTNPLPRIIKITWERNRRTRKGISIDLIPEKFLFFILNSFKIRIL